jgi:hypothetical protein
MRKLIAAAVVLASLAAPPSAAADDYRCVGIVVRPVVDNVIVPSGADCFLDGTHVTGNVTVEQDADILVELAYVAGTAKLARNATFESFGTEIVGDVACEGCFFEDVLSSTLRGNVKIKQEQEGSYIQDSTIHGNVSIEESSGGNAGF